MAIEYLPLVKDKPCINHKDCNKLNNYVGNLEWCTPKENMRHAWANGLMDNVYGSKKDKKLKLLEAKNVNIL